MVGIIIYNVGVMANKSKLIDETTFNNAQSMLESLGNNAKGALKLKAIVAAKTHGITIVADIFNVSRNTVTTWINKFKNDVNSVFEISAGRGRKDKLTLEQLYIVKELVNNNPNITLYQVAQEIEKKFAIKYTIPAVHKILKKLKFSYITPRPKHNKQDTSKHDEFKKNLAEEIQKNPECEVFFFDESRFGTHSKVGHGWFKTGTRTQINVSLGFKNFYVYSAVSSISGNNFHLMLPNVDVECFNVFLQEFSSTLNNKNIIMVLDGAGWHKAKNLNIPDNIRLVYLPPYSPELNPVEKLWEYIKNNTIKNKFFGCINKLEAVVSEFIFGLDEEQIKQTCRCSYLTS